VDSLQLQPLFSAARTPRGPASWLAFLQRERSSSYAVFDLAFEGDLDLRMYIRKSSRAWIGADYSHSVKAEATDCVKGRANGPVAGRCTADSSDSSATFEVIGQDRGRKSVIETRYEGII